MLRGLKIERKVFERLAVIRAVYEQQLEMYRQKTTRIKDRIVSLHRPWTRPIVRGKTGNKTVDFGPKATVSFVNGFAFLDHLAPDNFAEAGRVDEQIKQYERLFGRKPPYITADRIYGNRNNRQLLKDYEIRDAFEPLGRKNRGEKSMK